MNLRTLLHWFRQLDAWLVVPALGVVSWGELSAPSVGIELHTSDKALHFIAYFGLALMTTIAVRADRRALWWALALAVLGGVLEVVQGMTGRDMDVWDEFANCVGVAVGLGLAWAVISLLKAGKLVADKPPE